MSVQTDRDMLASGLLITDFPPQLDLYAGETDVITDNGIAGPTDLPIYQSIGRAADKTLVAHNPDATTTVGVVAATGTVTFSTAVPAVNDTVTINGVAITLKASGATGNQVNIGADLPSTAANLRDFVNANASALTVNATASAGVTTLIANATGTGGNSIALAKSGTNIAVSGATLANGTSATGPSPEATLIGFTAQPIPAGTRGPFYAGGFFNHLRMLWHPSLTTLDQRKAACGRSELHVGAVL